MGLRKRACVDAAIGIPVAAVDDDDDWGVMQQFAQ
jgi:hypothetical protein